MSRRGGGFSFPRGAARSAGRSRSRGRSRSPPPRTDNGAPPQALAHAPRFGGILQGIRSNTGEGMSFGTGSSAYHKAVNAVMGPHTTHHETLNLVPARGERPPHALSSIADMCAVDAKAFRDCLDKYRSDNSRCEYYLDILAACRRRCKPGGIFGYKYV